MSGKAGLALATMLFALFQDGQCFAGAACGFKLAFDRADEAGTKRLRVYEGSADASLSGVSPLAFVTSLKVNTDGTRISYKMDDPRAAHGAINDIRNAMPSGKSIADFERVRDAGWPSATTWSVLSRNVIEKSSRSGKPCVDPKGYLVSMTADVAVASGWSHVGDCDQSKWIDALDVPAVVLPSGRTEFEARGARTRSSVVAMTLTGPSRIAYGIVGDKGPSNELGEASVEMNRVLNGLPPGEWPSSARDAIRRFQAPRSVVLIFPGSANRLPYPVNGEKASAFSRSRFDAWGGEARLRGCLAELGS